MIHHQAIVCRYCGDKDLVKNRHSENSTQRWRCNKCSKSFQLNYTYNARKQGVKEKIVEYTLNSSGVRDISRMLQINKNTVIAELKKNASHESLSTKRSNRRASRSIGSGH